MAAVATMAVVTIAYAGPVSTSVPGAITFGTEPTPFHSTAAAIPAGPTADASPAAGPSASLAAGRTQGSGAPAVGPLLGVSFNTGLRPSTNGAPAAGERTPPAQTLQPVTAAVTDSLGVHTAGPVPGAAPAATLVPPAPPLTIGRPQPAATNTGRASAANPDRNRVASNANGGDAGNRSGRQSSGAGQGSNQVPGGVTPTAVAPDYPVISAQAVRQSASPPEHSGQGHSKGH